MSNQISCIEQMGEQKNSQSKKKVICEDCKRDQEFWRKFELDIDF